MSVQMKMLGVIICVLMNMDLTTVSVMMVTHWHLMHICVWVRATVNNPTNTSTYNYNDNYYILHAFQVTCLGDINSEAVWPNSRFALFFIPQVNHVQISQVSGKVI